MTFHDPLWLMAIVLPFALLWASRRVGLASLRFSSSEGLEELTRRSRPVRLRLPWLLRALVLVLIVPALARPQQGLESSRLTAEGIDIVLVVDVSTSMLAEDFVLRGERRNRLEVVKDIINDFVLSRSTDRIGLVVFAGQPYMASPMTLDHGWLLAQLHRVEIGMVEDGTAIGSAISAGLNRLRDSKTKNRIMVLLTDGVNNAGTVTPDSAAQVAKALDVKIYTIGAGTKGRAPYPVTDSIGRTIYKQLKIEVDDEGLSQVARVTGGQYFRATDTDSLRAIYREIDQMERSKLTQPQYQQYREWYAWFIVPAIALLLLAVVSSQTWLRVLP